MSVIAEERFTLKELLNQIDTHKIINEYKTVFKKEGYFKDNDNYIYELIDKLKNYIYNKEFDCMPSSTIEEIIIQNHSNDIFKTNYSIKGSIDRKLSLYTPLMFHSWNVYLNTPISSFSISTYGKTGCVCRLLFDMTLFGTTEEEILKRFDSYAKNVV